MIRRGCTAALVMFSVAVSTRALAQDRVDSRVSGEVVASAFMMSGNDHLAGMLDSTATVGLGRGLTGIVRPWYFRMPDGSHLFQWWQLQLRYQSRTRIPFRIDAGIITSPIGLNTLQNRADLNPAVSGVSYYFIPLPPFERRFDGVQPISAGYPVGAIVSASGDRWDLRGGVTDSSPVRPRDELKSNQHPMRPQAVIGGGYTPRAGLRIGGAIAHGEFRQATPAVPAGSATVTNVEAEWTINYTRLSAEWLVDRLDGTTGVQTGRAFYVQAVQTITPRLFAVTRIVDLRTPTTIATGRPTTWETVEASAGYRFTPSLTARAGYFRQRAYFRTWDNHAAVSVVWTGRWWR